MSDRATTVEDVERITARWNMGIGPDQLHDALGWTAPELERYQADGTIPRSPQQAARVANEIAAKAGGGLVGALFESIADDFQADAQEKPAAPPGKLSREYAEASWWVYLSRWRTEPVGDGNWRVRTERGDCEGGETPVIYPDNGTAQKRADTLNREERTAMIERLDRSEKGTT